MRTATVFEPPNAERAQLSLAATDGHAAPQQENAAMTPCVQTPTAPSTATVTLEIPAELAYVHILGRCVVAQIEPFLEQEEVEIILYNLELAVQEIAVNVVTHAYADTAGRVVMHSTYDPQTRQLSITLEDTGNAFDADLVQAPALGTLQEHGYGLFLATSLLDELHYTADSMGNCWKLMKQL